MSNTRKEKREARIERYKDLSSNAAKQSSAAFSQSSRMASVIPFGQPILVGHHSERGDRNYRAKIEAKMNKAVELSHKADYYAGKAASAESNNAIFLEDDDSIERLTEKVETLEAIQEKMKAANKIIKSKKLSEVEKVEQLQQIGFNEKTALSYMEPDYCGRIGFPSYSLTNNNARLKSAKDRLAKAIRLKETESKEYQIGEVNVVENTDENRLQLFFDGKPSDEIRAQLKSSAFRWTPSSGCWQSYLNRWQIDRAKTILNSLIS